MMRFPILVVVALVLPLVWGWAIHRIMVRIWPGADGASGQRAPTDSNPPVDYQI
jgi:hypothetical protein